MLLVFFSNCEKLAYFFDLRLRDIGFDLSAAFPPNVVVSFVSNSGGAPTSLLFAYDLLLIDSADSSSNLR